MPISLRQRIRSQGILCTPWHKYKGEIELLPVSSQCLFKRSGLPWDVLEEELKLDGWLLPDEKLWEVLSDHRLLLRRKLCDGFQEMADETEDFTEEDFKANGLL